MTRCYKYDVKVLNARIHPCCVKKLAFRNSVHVGLFDFWMERSSLSSKIHLTRSNIMIATQQLGHSLLWAHTHTQISSSQLVIETDRQTDKAYSRTVPQRNSCYQKMFHWPHCVNYVNLLNIGANIYSGKRKQVYECTCLVVLVCMSEQWARFAHS